MSSVDELRARVESAEHVHLRRERTMTEPRNVEYLPLSTLLEASDDRNPKAHDLPVVTESIDRFGFVEPVVLDGRTGRLVSGHGRVAALAAMAELDQAPPDGVRQETVVSGHGVPPGTVRWMVPVVTGWSSRSDAEAGAALVALNRAGERGGWDTEALTTLLADLAELDDGLDGTGFYETDLDNLRARLDQIGAEIPEYRDDSVSESVAIDAESLIDPDQSVVCPSCGFEWEA